MGALLLLAWVIHGATCLPAHMPAYSQDDEGYHLLWRDSLEERERVEVRLSARIPTYLQGSFYLNGPARWTLNQTHMTHALDGYAKLSHFEFTPSGALLFSSKFVQSRFLEESITQGTIAWGVLADETIPPRINPGIKAMSTAGDDNNNVNVFMLNQDLLALSDTVVVDKISPQTLETTGVLALLPLTPCHRLLNAGRTGGSELHTAAPHAPRRHAQWFCSPSLSEWSLHLAQPEPQDDPWRA